MFYSSTETSVNYHLIFDILSLKSISVSILQIESNNTSIQHSVSEYFFNHCEKTTWLFISSFIKYVKREEI